MLRAAARAVPERTALSGDGTRLSYRQLDALTSACAADLRLRVDEAGAVVGLAASLTCAFAVGYFGAMRSGHIVAPINPFLTEPMLAHVLRHSRAKLVFATPEMAGRLDAVRDHLEDLEHVVLLELADASVTGVDLDAGPSREDDLEEVACLLFTSGTTGLPKTVQLTHRNVTTNAVQVARAHGLDGSSVLLNHLPTFHPMHLTAGVFAHATQVLCTSPDAAESMRTAECTGATHYYSLPVRLAKLAVDPHLGSFAVPSLALIASGGSALAPAFARKLSEQFKVPVIQGYGLAETSPLTHSDIPALWKPGSVGPPVDDTECRIVDISSRAVLGTGTPGEVQLRGPQVMKGYLDDDAGSAIDADGWLSTGDVGYLDADGCLFLVDRIKDVFKCDNWLVSPTEIERVVGEHPAVAECVVVGVPDAFRGALPFAFVVPSDANGGAAAVAGALAGANERLAYYQQIERFEVVETIPRGPTGKVARAQLRDLASSDELSARPA